ncbi:MAG: undecaprenyl/decaprenyl-phosphate alpha-N-acetylglucosaminyl 1-phosphate transferase [Alphaproteobacteria bacterium]|nr:undecaprenyl/decaprenyl-phosphate alpha-N-acetylglucosaminyl 1-phosphate transferase [Alphaproteobacteria bacterium]
MSDVLSLWPLWVWPLFSLLAVLVLVPLARLAAFKLDMVDLPGGRKRHDTPVPVIGGLVVFPVFILVSVLNGLSFSEYWPLYCAIMVLLVTGAVDDRVELHSWTKFGMQFLAAFLVVLPGGAELHHLGDLFGLGLFGLGLISLPFSVVAVVLLINAINLMDGLDGLAGGVGFIALGWMLYAALSGGDGVYAPSIMILIGALAGFLFYNARAPWRYRAVVFMGDAGSMSLGLMTAWYAIHLSPADANVIEPISVAWVLALPIWDECAQFYRRVKEGRHPFSPDRGHFHHHFIDAGIISGRAVPMIWIIVFVLGAFGVLGMQAGWPPALITGLWIAGILTHMALSRDIALYTGFFKRCLSQQG